MAFFKFKALQGRIFRFKAFQGFHGPLATLNTKITYKKCFDANV